MESVIGSTELLLGLDSSITLILIEHDMDVALNVAERVTMMHDGRVIVEGTPAEIRANDSSTTSTSVATTTQETHERRPAPHGR